MNSSTFKLLQDDMVVSAKGNSVMTKNGVEIKADVVVLCTVGGLPLLSSPEADSSLHTGLPHPRLFASPRESAVDDRADLSCFS